MQNSYNKYGYLLIVVAVGAGIFFVVNKRPPVLENSPLPEDPKETVGNPSVSPPAASSPTYKQLITKGHELYLGGKYEEALSYFKQALKLEQNDRIYRSLYSVYLALKDYKNAEIAIRNAATGINKSTPNHWMEYAFFEAYYMEASFDVVSKIYLDGLKATKDNINLITGYAAYLTEQKKYNEAISYLEKAIIIDPARASTFQAEIDYLRSRQ